MIEAFSAYIKTIAAFMIFAVFAEIIMPDQNFKKYINIVLGFLMLITVLKPITTVFGKGGVDFSELVARKELELSQEYSSENNNQYEGMENKLILDVYKENIVKKITEKMESESITASNISLSVSEEENSYGQIQRIHVTVKNREEGAEKEINLVEPVKPVSLTIEKTQQTKASTELTKKAQSILEKEFMLSPECIEIEEQ